MSSLKMSMAQDREITPYKLSNGLNIYSIEEAIYLFYKNFKQYSTDFFEDKFINWVKNELKNNVIVTKLIDIKKQNFYQKSIEFLTINDFYKLDEIESISLELFNWEKRGQIESKKIKGDRFFNQNMFEKAIETYKDAIDFDVSNSVLYNNVGICYIRLKQYDLALTYLKKAINIDSNNLQILFNIIELLIEKQDFDQAINYIQSLSEDNLYEKNYYFGELYFKNKQYDKAKSFYIKCYIILKNNNIILKIAQCYLMENLYDKATKCLDLAKNEEIDILIEKSKIYEKLNNRYMAIKCIEKANLHNRNNYFLWIKLAQFYRQEYDLIKAEAAINKAYTLAPDNSQVLFEQSLIKKAKGKFKEYQNILTQVVQKCSNEYREKL